MATYLGSPSRHGGRRGGNNSRESGVVALATLDTIGVSMTFTMYSTPWCGYCHRLKGTLERDGITFSEVDIDADPVAAELVKKVNNGNATVPTLVFADGTTMTNPSPGEVKAKIAG
jgi:mycoredoxin